MPTKKRREKESERKLKDNAFGPIPDHLSDADMSLNKAAVSGWWGTNFVKDDENGEPYLHEKIGKGGNESRREDRKDAARELQRKYFKIWGKHGAAGEIVRKEKRINTEVKLSVRTVQRYIKDFPLK